jgi:hypothetical protein
MNLLYTSAAMNRRKDCKEMLRLLVFGFTIISGIVLLTVCFIMCPILLSKVREESFVMYLMYFMGAFLLWILLMAFACCLWRINEVCLCCFRNQWIHQQKMNDTEDIEDAENVILFEKVHIQSKSTHISYINE